MGEVASPIEDPIRFLIQDANGSEEVAVQFVNDPREHVAEGLVGLERAWPDLVRWNREPSFVARARNGGPKVALVAGGGSGNEPLHTGFVGEGMLDPAPVALFFESAPIGDVR